MAAVPERLGKYHILELIAQGGMAEVFKAKTVGIAGFEKVLALKRIRPRYGSEARFIRNFIDEARIAVSLNHRNIVQVFDFGKSEGELFLAMELLEGVDLRNAIKAARAVGRSLPTELSCYILADVAAGLDYAHRKCDSEGTPLGIVHCDVSPHNILLSNEGFVKILDFGVARARFVAAPTSKRLRGKPRYMAPEQTLGDPPSAASDVFVVGILAWELLTGRSLFDRKELRDILEAVRSAEIPDLAGIRPDLPEDLCQAVMRALNRQATERGTAADISTQLAMTGRELSDQSCAQALSEWLREIVEPEPMADETLTDVAPAPMPAPSASHAEEPTLTAPKLAVAEAVGEAGVDEDTGDTQDGIVWSAPSLAALIDKRRVVAQVLLLDGGMDDRRRELSMALCDLAYKRGAVVHERSNSEVVSIFGLEVAGEDDVASAMQFAMDAAELVRENTAFVEAGQGIALRSAARAGVVAQRKQGTYQLRGDPLKEARELARNAEPSRPLLSGGKGRSASAQFRFRELPARRYRSRRLRVLELIGRSNYDDRAQALRDRRGRFVGRRCELTTLWGCFRDRDTKLASSILISGAAGVGKSRLVAEFVAQLDESGEEPRLIAVAVTENAADAPFTVALDYLQAALHFAPRRGELARAEFSRRLASTLRECGMKEDQAEEVCLSVELAMELRDGALSGHEEASAALRERCTDAVRQFQCALASDVPSILVLENFHLADDASLEVFQAIAAEPSCANPPILIITSRDDHSLVEAFPHAEHLALPDLAESERAALITDRLAESMSDTLVTEVARRAGGNPLFIEELCRNIRDVGWEETPATVRDTVLARVDRLSNRSRAVLQRAAVIGESFRARILEELIAAPASTHLQELVEEGLLVRSDQAEYEADGGRFSFRHGLIQEVVYNSLSVGARRATHGHLGRLLSLRDEAGLNEPPALTARHLELGGFPIEAAVCWTKAGRSALAAFETLTARGAFDRALAIIEQLDEADKLRTREQQIEALFGRARAFRDLGSHDSQGADLRALEPLVEGDARAKAELLNRMADRHLRNGAYQEAMSHANRAIEAARKAESPLARGEALRIIGEAYERTGKFDLGLESTSRALLIFEELGARSHETRARISMARSQLVQANYAEARSLYEPVLEEIRHKRDPWIERIANNHLAVIHLCLGEFEDAMHCAERSVRLCELDGDQARAGDNLSVCGIVLGEVGQYDQARERFQRALALHEATKSRWSQADSLIYAGTNEAMLGDYDRAFEYLQKAYDEAVELEAPYVQSNAGIALAGAYLDRNEPGDAERAHDMAHESAGLAHEATLVGAQAMALSRQAEALRRRGMGERALAVSQSALEILDRQGHVEGSEEEILYQHFLVLSEVAPARADPYLQRASDGFERKLNAIKNPDWRRSYREEVPINVAIQEATAKITR